MSKTNFDLLIDSDSDKYDLSRNIKKIIKEQLSSDSSPIRRPKERLFGSQNNKDNNTITSSISDNIKKQTISEYDILQRGRNIYLEKIEKKTKYKKLTKQPEANITALIETNDYNQDQDQDQERDKEHDPASHKRVLCYNMLNRGSCSYGTNCVYAHSLQEQRVIESRKTAYEIIQHTNNLSELDLMSEQTIHNSLLQLTKICTRCASGVCPGGYNCKFGSYCKQYQLCYHDYMNGNCNDNKCLMNHLTTRGLIPYNVQKIRNKLKTHNAPKRRLNMNYLESLQSGNIEAAKPKNGEIMSQRQIKPPIDGLILSETYFTRSHSKKINCSDSMSDVSMEEEEAELTKKYIQDPTQDEPQYDLLNISECTE
jgi:hypothetical protein